MCGKGYILAADTGDIAPPERWLAEAATPAAPEGVRDVIADAARSAWIASLEPHMAVSDPIEDR